MKCILATDFDEYWHDERPGFTEDEETYRAVREIIQCVRVEGDAGLRRYAAQFDKSSPEILEIDPQIVETARETLGVHDPALRNALELAASHILQFAQAQKTQLVDFECEISPGLIAGQRVVPIHRAGIYIPGGRYPLISTVLMTLIPALCAGVPELILASPPNEAGCIDSRILAAAGIARAAVAGSGSQLPGSIRCFAMGGAHAIAALALGTETVPPVDFIAGPGNRFVAAAKRLLFGEVGIDCIAGPTDVLIIADQYARMDLAAADMLAQAEHDPDARARILLPTPSMAEELQQELEMRLEAGNSANAGSFPVAKASLDSGGLLIIYDTQEEAIRIANAIAPEHLELHTQHPERWIPALFNFGSLFIGSMAAEVLGDYSAGINHTLPTVGSTRYTGGLSVRHFLKILTSLRCRDDTGFQDALNAAQIIAKSEGLFFHSESAGTRR